MKCILCNSANVFSAGTIDNKDIITLYRKRAKVDVNKFFKETDTLRLVCKDCDLIFYSPSTIGDGKFYDELQKYNNYYMEEKAEFKEAATFIHPKDNVLEIGCGKGIFPGYIKCESYTGLEFSEEAIKTARKKNLNVSNERLEDHAKKNKEKYEVVCFFQVLEHVENPGRFIKEAVECLKPGGRLILAVPSEDSFIKDANNFYLNMPPHHASCWTDAALKNLGKLHGLTVKHIYHEPLQRAHKLFYAQTTIYNKTKAIFKPKNKSTDLTPFAGLLHIWSVGLAIFLKPVIVKNSTRGQSVLVVYEKL